MTARKFAICPNAEHAALHYGDTVSQGILHMVEEIDRLKREVKNLKGTLS